jgi:hypothetical protein
MAFTFKLEDPHGTPADPPTIRSAGPNWEVGDKTVRPRPATAAGRRVAERERS